MLKLESKEAVEYVLEEYPKLNKSRLAKMLGVSPQAINNYINYNSKLSRTTADKMAELFKIDITDCTYMNRIPTVDEMR